ncbi:hypothetical protein DUNSADRAFT_17457 [Dunaliella salina]|uniref:Elongation factor Tu, chloroplastic n=1 Tax=Dunaliella salina TaxID=3046 RepID=A0ABQ7G1R4_DUNSA|nr:hypothetical protein DUNSADRAFT_17457 [Dunaliella salina]|eukprot:KAF5828548.1 hypothetical protein DUNSADRAFT_17457 [Dunaliella salina]
MRRASKLLRLAGQLAQQQHGVAAAGAAVLSTLAPASAHAPTLCSWAAAAASTAFSPSAPIAYASNSGSAPSVQGPGCIWPACSRVLRHGFHTSSPTPSKNTATSKKTAVPHGHTVDPSKGLVYGGYTVDMFPIEHIRNFCIVAHVDHGKSTLADRLMEATGAFGANQTHEDQFLDKLQVERDRGITVKAQTVSLVHRHNGIDYLLNLIDTPGHVDFSYEVSRSLLACQGALLLVDAVQGVQAQTVANWKLAIEQGLVVVPALNKIDLPQADPDAACQQVCEACEILDESEVLRLSAKTGLGMEHVLPAIIERIPPPKGRRDAPCRLLLFDAFHDPYRGVVALVEVRVLLCDAVHGSYRGVLALVEVSVLLCGAVHGSYRGVVALVEVSVLLCGAAHDPYRGVVALVEVSVLLCGAAHGSYQGVVALVEVSVLLCHAVHGSYRGVVALVEVMDGSISRGATIESYASREKWEIQELGILAPNRRPQQTLYTGQVGYVITGIKDLKAARVGDTWLVAGTRTEVEPLPGFRSAKSMVYASLYPVDSEDFDSLAVAMGRLSLNDASVSVVRENSEALGPGFRCGFLGMLHMEVFMQRLDHEHGIAVVTTTPTDEALYVGRAMSARMKQLLDRQQFEVVIQAMVSGKVVARETLRALRKDVTAKCYGGDISRKRKLLEKQKEGKKRMKRLGGIDVPAHAFPELMKTR